MRKIEYKYMKHVMFILSVHYHLQPKVYGRLFSCWLSVFDALNMDENTKQEIAEMVAHTMHTHQTELLKTAANNALAIVDKRISQNTS